MVTVTATFTDGATMLKMVALSRPPFVLRLAAIFIVATACFCTGLYSLIYYSESERLTVEHTDSAQAMADSLSIVLRSPMVAMDVAFVADYSQAVIKKNPLLVEAKVTLADSKTLYDTGHNSARSATTVYSDVQIENKVIGQVALSFDSNAASIRAKTTAERYARIMCAVVLLLYATVAWFVQRQMVSPIEAIVRQLDNLNRLDDVLNSSFDDGIQPTTAEVYQCAVAIKTVSRTLVSRAHDAERLSEQLQLQITEKDHAWRLTESKSTQLAEAVNELRLQQAALVEAGELRAQQEVIRRIAHDLNNMLTPAVIATDMLQKEYSGKSEGEEELISLIHSALGDAAHLVSIMKPRQADSETVRNTEEMRTHLFADIWRECGRLASMQEAVREEESELIFHQNLMKIVHVRVQLAAMRNAILNLVVNACEQASRATHGNDISEIDCSWQIGPSYLQINISDNCGGVSADILPFIWKFGVSNKDEKPLANRGMGLVNARSTVRRHGGDLYLKRNDRAKTTFTIVLPVEGSSNKDDFRPNCAGCTALVVDDEKDVRDSVTRLLEGCGVLVTAVDPEELSQVEHNSYEIYLIDVRLGPINGGDLMLKLLKRDPGAFFALMTAYEDDLTEQQLVQLKGVRVLSKPLTLAVLYDLLDSISRLHSGKLKLLE
jgi:signal transduction histidine kinase